MMVEELRKRSDDQQPTLIQFSPWHWRDPKEATAAFLREIRLAVLRSSPFKQKFAFLLSWGKYARLLQGTADTLATAKAKLILWIGLFASVGLTVSGLVPPEMRVAATWFGSALTLATILLSALGSGLGALLSFCEGSDKTLEELRESLTEQLKALPKNIVVIVDDIDRSTDEEIRSIISLVKSSLNFPRLIFLLLFDQKIVEQVLSLSSANGRKYLQKVVQIPLVLPRVEEGRVEKVLIDGLNDILGQFADARHGFDEGRWALILYEGVNPIVRNVRDVYRLLAVLSGMLPALRGRTTLEVNAVDLIALQTLAVFEPALFKKLPDAKQLLLSSPSNDTHDERAEEVRTLLEYSSAERLGPVSALVAHLFPSAARYMPNVLSPTFSSDWARAFRVCTEEFFDRYFIYAVPDHQITEQAFSDLLKLLPEGGAFRREVMKMANGGLIIPLLRRTLIQVPAIDFAFAEEFLSTMFDLSEAVDSNPQPGFGVNDYRQVWSNCIQFLVKEPDPEKRSAAFIAAFGKSHGLSTPGQILRDEQISRKSAANKNDLLLSDGALETGRALWLQKIVASAADQSLGHTPHVARIWFSWRELDSSTAPIQWLVGCFLDDQYLLKMLTGFVDISFVSTGGITKRRAFFKLDHIANHLDLPVVVERLKRMDESGFTAEQREAVAAFVKAVRDRSSGKTDATIWHDDW